MLILPQENDLSKGLWNLASSLLCWTFWNWQGHWAVIQIFSPSPPINNKVGTEFYSQENDPTVFPYSQYCCCFNNIFTKIFCCLFYKYRNVNSLFNHWNYELFQNTVCYWVLFFLMRNKWIKSQFAHFRNEHVRHLPQIYFDILIVTFWRL